MRRCKNIMYQNASIHSKGTSQINHLLMNIIFIIVPWKVCPLLSDNFLLKKVNLVLTVVILFLLLTTLGYQSELIPFTSSVLENMSTKFFRLTSQIFYEDFLFLSLYQSVPSLGTWWLIRYYVSWLTFK